MSGKGNKVRVVFICLLHFCFSCIVLANSVLHCIAMGRDSAGGVLDFRVLLLTR